MHATRPVPVELPGAGIVGEGVADLAAARDSVNSNAVAMAFAREGGA